MTITSLLAAGNNISLTVTPADLEEFAISIFEKCRDEYAPKSVPERYLSRKEVMSLLDCSDATLWRWQQIGYLVPVKVGRKCRYKQSDISRILQEKGGEA